MELILGFFFVFSSFFKQRKKFVYVLSCHKLSHWQCQYLTTFGGVSSSFESQKSSLRSFLTIICIVVFNLCAFVFIFYIVFLFMHFLHHVYACLVLKVISH
jgi:hypothetical protein